MLDLAPTNAQSESQFAAFVGSLTADRDRWPALLDLLREEHPIYDRRGASTVVRMRGWVLLALARTELTDRGLVFVLEELDAGRDAYLVAAAARALRSYVAPRAEFGPFLMRAFDNIRFHDELVSFDTYGEYATSSTGTTAVRELFATLAWVGPLARAVLPQIEALRATRGTSKKLLKELDGVVDAITRADQQEPPPAGACCGLPDGLGAVVSWLPAERRGSESIEAAAFEDHNGARLTFRDFFYGQPTIVVFFYTRCDNPLKCSLTISKLARIQAMLAEQGLAEQIRTAAITYDPAYDRPECLRGYGQSRGLRMDAAHRALRAVDGVGVLRGHFDLGVNFIETLINRHRIELYLLDAQGRIAILFERIRWDEQEVVARAAELLRESHDMPAPHRPETRQATGTPVTAKATTSPFFGAAASVGLALFPKCPVCWAAYLSTLGIAGLERIPYTPWLQSVLIAAMLINLASVWWRGRSTGRTAAFYLVAAGAAVIAAAKLGFLPVPEFVAPWGIAATVAGSSLSVLSFARLAPLAGRRVANIRASRA